MDPIKSLLEKRADLLSNRIESLKLLLEPEREILRGARRGDSCYFYLRKACEEGRKDIYIPRTELRGYRRLAKSSYSKTILPVLEHDLEALDRFLGDYSFRNEKEHADRFAPQFLDLCGSGFESRETFIQKWKQLTWTEQPQVGSEPSHPTLAGHLVRSKSEAMIDNALYAHGLAAHYEKPLYLKDRANPRFPDFSILHPILLKVIYWEHLGRLDDPQYADKNCAKITELMRNGIFPGENLIITFETEDHPLLSTDIEMIIEHYFGC